MNKNSNRRPGFLFQHSGFTLVEILVVVAIMGILAAIAMTSFNNSKERAYCASVKADLSSLAQHQESYYSDHQAYSAVVSNPDGSTNLPGFKWSPGVTMSSSTGNTTAWTASAMHPRCASSPYTWDSSVSGFR